MHYIRKSLTYRQRKPEWKDEEMLFHLERKIGKKESSENISGRKICSAIACRSHFPSDHSSSPIYRRESWQGKKKKNNKSPPSTCVTLKANSVSRIERITNDFPSTMENTTTVRANSTTNSIVSLSHEQIVYNKPRPKEIDRHHKAALVFANSIFPLIPSLF